MAKQLTITNGFYLIKCGLVAVSLAAMGLMAGCGEDGGSSGGAPATIAARISGTISNKNGPIGQGRLEVRDNSGNLVTSTEFTNSGYTVSVPPGTVYPILLTAYPPSDAVLNDPVKAVVTSAIADRMDITAVTTDVVDGALALGGLTEQNIVKASGVAINMRQKEGVSAATGGGGAGPGQSGGGTGQGGHGGHSMEAMKKSSGESSTEQK